MRNAANLIVALIIALGALPAAAPAQEADSLKVKNEIKAENQGADQGLRIRSEERIQSGKTEEAEDEGAMVRTRNENEEDKLRVRTLEGDKAQGESIQARFRDENGDGIPDSTQAKKQERNQHRIRSNEKKQDGNCSGNMTPQGAAAGNRKRGAAGKGRKRAGRNQAIACSGTGKCSAPSLSR